MSAVSSSLWRQPVFAGLFASTALLALGGQIYQLALPLILYELTHSLAAMSNLRAVEFLPNLALAAVIGVWVDRVCRRSWAQRALLAMAVLLGGCALALAAGGMRAWLFYPLTFCVMLCNYVTAICRMALVKESVPQAQLVQANGYLGTLSDVFAVSGPLLSGLLIAWARPHWSLGVPAVMFLCSALLMVRVPKSAVRPSRERRFLTELADGWRALRGNAALWQLSWIVVLANGSAGVAEVLFLFRARDQLGLSPGELGVLFGCAGAGGIVAGLRVAQVRRWLGLGRMICLALLLEAAGMAAQACLDSPTWLAGAMALQSFAVVCGNVGIWSYRQEATPAELIGRVSGLTGSLFKLLMPLALLLGGMLSADMPLRTLMLATAAWQLAAGALCCFSRVRTVV
ncbi:MFS transporter [Chromobacterium sp. IIBBL 290-4]|uniref:MFS transporter n=1 Tax=Chromobacterium sp. IIBBL 290-4 TaxID=2953890 RepID=UPI0020B85A82|nr:MFS transporter [Chromobacterium sp. IIBBL 290-4]UTH74885.1 MFS transporter [Chromobacterium sp. IIBBL 290-4]